MSTFYRTASANQYENALRNLSQRQTALSNLQENLTSGKRVVRASDDPVAAAQAERAITRISRVQSEQRALENARNTVTQAESTLGQAVDIVQELRQLIVSAGGGTLKPEDRKTIMNQVQGLREQLSDMVNRKDTNGLPLLGALGSALAPFLGPQSGSPDYSFAGLPGQASGSATSLPMSLDGESAFMFQPKRDGVYTASVSNIPTGRLLTTDGVKAGDTSLITGDDYQIVFSGVGPGATAGTTTATYTITNMTTGVASAPVTVPDFPADKPVSIAVTGIPGVSFNITGTPTKQNDGTYNFSPANGDTISLKPSASIFSSIDQAVRDIGGATNGNAAAQAVGQALNNIDIGLERIQNMRGYAGELLNRADRITGDQDKRADQLEADRSRAEDLDMIKGISDFQNNQTGYQAALQSYAQVQKLSLFNYIS
ncbi:flagellar hook-associated protein 3 [Paracidovorax avenae ATCC 19860]|uniref:Flagellar hook-associated protein 3 n=1 Tax=Paracidovorax avenae (strain ATCC 19860 / DSM 7227 / CCUG 15838 / JCM 20985 / LMG 2117 / NCPPB 1011) TaxID=643561 RepID=F0Q7M7_PARA1|nr:MULTISPECIES: flagellar hook-associated protein FlgL [Comamonadaceae]ADX48209.1 flagellar hook-associated protein 3 [Paracidovorax avenae ATCC 19860]AVS65699.1 flagellar hook-associated protein 3 [Paracidovorax avenae]MDA8451862.1 flagellar hook-associated protein FlgL [Acidovorax sp. GBBC 3297]MDA8461308.1 flagellar hook-associated protein FlgL [Acidovorax sp. GBBC 3333]MDA8466341.1 flagellar hook-associated protein FlgL [Acidovorax sp. GBBC 3332]